MIAEKEGVIDNLEAAQLTLLGLHDQKEIVDAYALAGTALVLSSSPCP